MSDVKTQRPYRERLLDDYGRSELRRQVQQVRPKAGMDRRKRYATWALGASLAIGGLGAPLKMIDRVMDPSTASHGSSVAGQPLETVADDLRAAQRIAQSVAGGVEAVVSSPLDAVTAAPRKLALVSEQARENFFKAEVPFGSIIYREAMKHDVEPELVAAVVQAESRFKPTARSQAGAIGLMQLVPKTGKWMGAKNLTNPAENIAAGTRYLSYLNERFDGDQRKVIAAYNAGEGNVRRFNGVPPFNETRNYVTRVESYQKEFGDRVDSTIAALNDDGPALSARDGR